ncbi:MAG: ABC transporter ATP-binding protein [Gemmatimonadaceae bacterium]|nr:ABC transporter ATP-binding protein [Gemmatimonadaceae bacterium]
MSALRFDRVTVQYAGATRVAVDQVSLDVLPGRLTAVVGPNGSGKSSLVRTLLGRVPVLSGQVRIGDDPLSSLKQRDVARRVAIVPQREEPMLPLTVREFVMLGRHPHRGAFGAASSHDHDLVHRAMERADALGEADRRTDTLSGGEWQRVRIARALAQDTGTLVLDEPTTFLDVAHEMAVFELADSLAKEGKAVLVVSHQLNLVARFADHMVLLHRGRVAASGAPADVMHGEILEAVYEWPLVITRDPAVGAPALVPLRGRRY